MADDGTPTLTDLASDLASVDVKEEIAATQEPATAEPSTVENKEPEADGQSETGEASSDQEADPAEEVTEAEAEEPEKPSVADQRKEQLSGEIRDLVTTRNQLKQEVEQLTAGVYRPQTAEEIMADTGQNANDARITAMEQRQELRDYNDRIAEQQLVLRTESQRVLRDFPMFDPSGANYQEGLAQQAATLLEKNLIRDPNIPEVIDGQNTGRGMVIGSHLSPYELYKPIADAFAVAAVANRAQGQKAAEQMLASADPQSSTPPKETKEDAFLTGLTRKF